MPIYNVYGTQIESNHIISMSASTLRRLRAYSTHFDITQTQMFGTMVIINIGFCCCCCQHITCAIVARNGWMIESMFRNPCILSSSIFEIDYTKPTWIYLRPPSTFIISCSITATFLLTAHTRSHIHLCTIFIIIHFPKFLINSFRWHCMCVCFRCYRHFPTNFFRIHKRYAVGKCVWVR